MASIEDLSGYVTNRDVKGFLRCYMSLVTTGVSLSVPTSLESEGAKDGWGQVFGQIGIGSDPPFLEELTPFWLTVVKKQGGKITPQFAEEILAVIDGKPMPTPASPAGTSAKTPGAGAAPTPDTPSPSREDDIQPRDTLDTVASSISPHYYKEQAARDTKPPDQSLLEQQAKKALKLENTDDFLVAHLSLSRHGIKPPVPISSVVGVIQSQWEEIVMNAFHHSLSDDFLAALSKRWFYLVNQKGLPVSISQYQDILFYLIAQQEKETKQPGKAPKNHGGFFKKISKLFS